MPFFFDPSNSAQSVSRPVGVCVCVVCSEASEENPKYQASNLFASQKDEHSTELCKKLCGTPTFGFSGSFGIHLTLCL